MISIPLTELIEAVLVHVRGRDAVRKFDQTYFPTKSHALRECRVNLTNTHTVAHTHTHPHGHTVTHTHTHTVTHPHPHGHTHTDTHPNIHTHTPTHTYIHTHTHTHTHTPAHFIKSQTWGIKIYQAEPLFF